MKCKVCNNELKEGSLFCPKCGSHVEEKEIKICPDCGMIVNEGDLFCINCGAKIVELQDIKCKNCGIIIKKGDIFCPNCGNRVSRDTDNSIDNEQLENKIKYEDDKNIVIEELTEKELYKKQMIGYYAGIRQITGTFIVTNKKILYTPLPLYLLDKKFEISMNDIKRAIRESVMGMNVCIKVFTKTGKNYLFALGIQNNSDIQYVVDLINNKAC